MSSSILADTGFSLVYSFSLSSLQATITKISPVLLPFVITPVSGLASFTINPPCCHAREAHLASPLGCNPGFNGRLRQRVQPLRLTASYFSSERQRSALASLEFHSILPRLFSFSTSPFSSFECEGGGKDRNTRVRETPRGTTRARSRCRCFMRQIQVFPFGAKASSRSSRSFKSPRCPFSLRAYSSSLTRRAG